MSYRGAKYGTAAFALVCAIAGCAYAEPMDGAGVGPCSGKETSIVVNLEEHSLYLCDTNAVVSRYRVSIGRGGTGKRKRGDNKTPVGVYAVGRPRPSKKFGTFIPIGYPTASQKKEGYTGDAIGIHGPSRAFAWAGGLNTVTDWTQGCIALQSDEAIQEIAGWVKQKRPRRAYLLARATGESRE